MLVGGWYLFLQYRLHISDGVFCLPCLAKINGLRTVSDHDSHVIPSVRRGGRVTLRPVEVV